MPPTPHQYTTTPWRHPSELLKVRQSLYNPVDPTDRSHVLSLISAWKARNNLPHAIESTALLFSALSFHQSILTRQQQQQRQHPESQANTPSPADAIAEADSFAIRATYTTALTRFVTGFADLGRHRAGPGQTMQEVARSINLPARFVELRHEATHEEMPGLGRLVKMAEEAVGWLWEVYWADLEAWVLQGEGEEVRASETAEEEMMGSREDEVASVAGRAAEILKGFRSRNLANLKGSNKATATRREIKDMSDQCVEMCGRSTTRWSTLVGSLMQLIVPSRGDEKSIDKHMEGAKLLWEDLLRKLATASPTFLTTLVESIIIELARPGRSSSKLVDGGLRFWLERILTTTIWRKSLHDQTQGDLCDLAMETCCLYPADLSRGVADMLLDARGSDASFLDRWQAAYQAAFGPVDEDDEMDEDGAEPLITLSHPKSQVFTVEDEKDVPIGRRIDRGPWSAVPIGAVST